MNILLFSTNDHIHSPGGAENAMYEIAKRMPGVQFDLVCAKLHTSAKRFEEVGNVRIHRLGLGVPKIDGYILALFGHLKAISLYKKYHHDLIWSVMASYGAFSAVRVKKKTGIPFLLTLQEGDAIGYILSKPWMVRKQFNRIFSSADALQPISNFLRSWGISMGFKGEFSDVIPNGVDIDAFTKRFDLAEIKLIRAEFGFTSDATIVITSSRLEIKNGVGDIIDALTLLPKEVCLVICGGGSLEEQLKQKVKNLNLEERVLFKGFVPIKFLPRLLKASDVFIRPSLSEGLGNAFLEAMASGLITIGTPVGGIPDFLFDGKTGFMCEPSNPKSVANTIQKVIALSNEEETNIKVHAKEMVIGTYNWEKISKSMETLFNSVKGR